MHLGHVAFASKGIKTWKVEETSLANKDIRIGRKMHLGHVAFASKDMEGGRDQPCQ